MDAKHRHELEQNDLQEFLTNFNQWWEKHGTKTLVVVLVIAVVVVGYFWKQRSENQANTAAWTELETTAEPTNLGKVADAHSVPMVSALAHLRAGDEWLKQAIGKPDTNAQASDLDAAMKSYETVIGGDFPLPVRLNAMLGKASVLETKKDFDAAETLYKDIVAKSVKVAGIKAIAEARLSNLAAIREPIVLVADPKPENPLLEPGTGGGIPGLTPPLDITPGGGPVLPEPGFDSSIFDNPGTGTGSGADDDTSPSGDSPFTPVDGSGSEPKTDGEPKADGD